VVVVAHISDLHFGREVPALAAALIETLRAIAPDFVAVSGDLTQHGRRAELAAAREFIEALPAPALVVPGNHDMPKRPWSRFVRPWARWHAVIERPLEPTLTGPGYVAAGVNTARTWRPHFDWSRGRIGDAQLDTIEQTFAAAGPHDVRVLVAHHPFLLGEAERHRGLVGGAEAALVRLRRARVDLVLGGHVHLGYADAVGGVVVAQSGTTFSDRLKGEPQGFNRITVARRRLVVEHYRAVGERFERDEISEFVRNDGWARTRVTSEAPRTSSGTSRSSAR